MSDSEYFYHATTADRLHQIMTDGQINPNTYFGIKEIADYYAVVIEEEGDDLVMLKIPASYFDVESVEVDWPGISEPVTYTSLGIRESEVHELWEESDKSPQACIEIIGSFLYAKSIPFRDDFIVY